MATESSEPPPVILYDTLAPLVEDSFQDEYIALSPSSSGYTFAEERLRTMNETVTEVSTSTLPPIPTPRSSTSPPAGTTGGGGGTDESQDRVGATSSSPIEESDLRQGIDSSGPEVAEEEVMETEFSEEVGESVQAEAVATTSAATTSTPLTKFSKDEGEDFLSLDLDDDEGFPAPGVMAVEEKGLLVSDVKTSAAQEAPPWARTGRAHGTWFRSPFLQLHQEIVDFCDFVAPTEEEKQLRADAVQRVRDVIMSIWPSCQVKVFGSFATGLFLPTSDCDVVILDSGCQVPQDGLKAIAKALNRKSLVKNLQVIGKARVPIVKFVEIESNIAFDISFDVANGPDAAEFIRDAMAVLPPLKPLCLVLKIFLQQRELNEVYTGGIGSYALLVMLLTHLQMHPSRRNVNNRGEPSPLESNLGILLVDFFEFYGRALNVREVGISCRSGGRFYAKAPRGFLDPARPYLLSVEDPQSPDNDIGKNSYNVTKVRSAFVLAHRLLTKLEVEGVPAQVGLLGRIVRMDKILMKRKSTIPESPLRLGSQIKLPDVGPSGSSPVMFPSVREALESFASAGSRPSVREALASFASAGSRPSVREALASFASAGSRWLEYDDDDDDFPRGGDPELEHKSSRKRKQGKEREDREGARDGDGDAHISHSQDRRRRDDDLDHRGESSSGKRRRYKRGKGSVELTSTLSPLTTSRFHEQPDMEQEAAGASDVRVSSNGKASSKQPKWRRRGGDGHDDHDHEDAAAAAAAVKRTPDDGKKNRSRKRSRHQKEGSHEEGEIVLKEDFAIGSMETEETSLGAGNGHNNHKRWFNEALSPKPTQSRAEQRTPRSPEGGESLGSGRSVRKIVITTAAHKKIKYL